VAEQPAAPLPFAKLQAAGNGYLAVDGRGRTLDWSELARRMTDPHFGAGSDGLLVVQTSERAALRMRVFNSDGSEAEMSGNGIRLFAKFVLDRGMAVTRDGKLSIETGGGVRCLVPELREGRVCAARVDMGEPRFEPEALPATLHALAVPVVDHPLEVAGRTLRVTLVSLGNPHAVVFPDEAVEEFPLAEVGPLVQMHSMFPRSVNFEVANVLGRDRLRARIYERGEGETLASGTGSTACAVAARLRGAVDDTVHVELRGGELRIDWPGKGEAFLTGPATEVYRGDWPAQALPG
jgi:diaminopimelate epimerase